MALSSKVAEWALTQKQSFLALLVDFSPDDDGAFSEIVKRCPNVDITYKELASWANVSHNTIRRWANGESRASRYEQIGLVEDIKSELQDRIMLAEDSAA